MGIPNQQVGKSALFGRMRRRWFAWINRMADGRSHTPDQDELGGASLRGKVMLLVLTTTCLALLLSASALLLYESHAYRQSRLSDLQTQADIIARATAPALSFKDANAATENLHMLRLRPQITAAAIYLTDGRLFAQYTEPHLRQNAVPRYAGQSGMTLTGDRLELYHPIRQNEELLGTLYLRAEEDFMGRLVDYVMILAAVMAASTAVAALITSRLQRAVTEPILQVAQVARDVMVHRNFNLRVPKTSSDEVGQLVDAFNNMLTEVASRTTALEEINHHLSVEMAERRKAEEALKDAARLKDEFLATLAHELRNPLAPISNAVEIIRRVEERPSPLQKRALDIMTRQLQQMVRLIDDLLDVARITTGKLQLHKERIDLVLALHSALEIATPKLESRQHTLNVDLPDHPVYLDADATRLAQVFANLLNNAAKYTADGGLISLRLTCNETEAAISVKDNGIGIAAEMQEAVFDMFVQVDQSLDRGRAGLGLGLSLARELTMLHGGRIELFSEGLSRGSEFIVRLPLNRPYDLTPDVWAPEPAHADTGPALRVMVADDNVDFALSLGQILESLGHRVSIAHDGLSAINIASAVRPDIVFLDIGMPGMNGHEVAHQLKRQAETQHAVLVAITGWSQDKDRDRSRQTGIRHHLAKPIDIKQLIPILKDAQANVAAR